MEQPKVYFASAEKIRAGFPRIIEADPAMADQKAFFDFLLGCAGGETNVMFTVLTIVTSLGYIAGAHCITLYGIAEALIDDTETLQLVKESLNRIAANMQRR